MKVGVRLTTACWAAVLWPAAQAMANTETLPAAAPGNTTVAREPVAVVVPATVVWRGIPAPTGPGAAGAMLYPAPTPLLGLVAVLTHGALMSGARAAEEKRLQDEADQSLTPYQPALSTWTPQALFDAALPLSAAQPGVAAPEGQGRERWRVLALPTFALHADRSRLVLDNQLRITDTTGAGLPVDLMVRVLSNRRADDAAFDPAAEAAQLKAESARLLAHSIDVALHARSLPADGAGAPFRTHRYQDGAREAMERAQLLGTGCGRVVLRTLRGWLLSVPQKSEAQADCSGSAYEFPRVAAAKAPQAALASPALASAALPADPAASASATTKP